MSRFRQFLNEGRSKSIGFDQAVEIAKDNCKNAIRKWMSERKIFRAIDNMDSYLLIDPRGTTRRSANTENYYTLWINNHESWKAFPNRKIICAGGSGRRAYGHGSDMTYAVLPFDDAKIGICTKDDIWDSFNMLDDFGWSNANGFNMWISYDLPRIDDNNWESFKKRAKNINVKNDLYKRRLRPEVRRYFKDKDFISLYDFMELVLDPKKNYFDLQNISKYKLGPEDDKEVWLDQPCLMVDPARMKNIIEELGF